MPRFVHSVHHLVGVLARRDLLDVEGVLVHTEAIRRALAGLSGAEELADIWRIFARFSEGMPAWSLTDEFREPGFMLYLLMEDRER
jgi:hypothetical protein